MVRTANVLILRIMASLLRQTQNTRTRKPTDRGPWAWRVPSSAGRPGSGTRRRRAPGLLARTEVLEGDVAEGHFHRRAGVDLPGDDALRRHLLEVIVHRRLAVEFDGDVLADALDVVVVELLDLEHLLDEVLVGGLHHAAEALAVETAPVRT